MVLKIFTIFDHKVEAFLQPFFMKSRGEATRAFSELVSDSKHQFGKYPSDYTLFELGSYDDNDAHIESHLSPQPLGNGLEFKVAAT